MAGPQGDAERHPPQVPDVVPPVAAPSPRILFVTTIGATLRAFLLPHMEMLRQHGWQVEAACNLTEPLDREILADAVACVHSLPLQRRVLARGNLVALGRLRRLLRTETFDIVHVHTPIAAMVARLAARPLRRRPVVLYTAHGFHFFRGAPWYYWALFYPAERLAARWTDGLIVMNAEDWERGQRLGFVPDETLFRVRGVGLDLERYGGARADGKRVREEFGLEGGDVLITCIAEFTPGKSHELLLEAWRRIAVAEDRTHLLLVGVGARYAQVQRRLRTWANSRVHLAGHRTDVPGVLQATDVLVLASRREGLPRCIMEAMAAGRPVVATNVRGSRDLIEHGVNGLLVPPGDPDALAEALLVLARDPELRDRMGRANREKIGDYAIERVLEEMWALYARYVETRGSGTAQRKRE